MVPKLDRVVCEVHDLVSRLNSVGSTKVIIMKRRSDDCCALVAPRVRLNVGGVYYETTRETLSKASYWRAYIEGMIGHATDQDGRLFLDRDGKLFGYLLNFMRSRIRPSNRILSEWKEALIAECEFYGLDWMLSDLQGVISEYDMRLPDRLIRQSEMENAAATLHDVFLTPPVPTPRTVLQVPLLMDRGPCPLVIGNYACFHERLDTLTGGLLASFKEIPGLVIAGGAVVSALTGGMAGDVDVFFTKSHEQGLKQAFAAIQRGQSERSGPKTRLLVTRSNAAVTVFRATPEPNTPIQLITNTYTSVHDVLVNFDLDSCCFAWTGDRVVCTSRGLRAITHGVNLADNGRFDGAVYCRRLEKYADRGFAIGVPGLDVTRISRQLLAPDYLHLCKYDLLLKLGPRERRGVRMPIQTQQTSVCGKLELETCDLTVGYTQQGTPVRGIQRLIVFDHWQCVSSAETPHAWCCSLRKMCGATHAGMTGAVVPLVTGPQSIGLIWCAGFENEGTADTVDEGYSETPLASAYRLLALQFERELTISGGDGPCDEMWKGGAMQKLASAMHSRCGTAVRAARDDTSARLASNKPILYVYDFCSCTTAFDELAFVNDAGRAPLDARCSDGEFKAAYGLTRKLCFTRRTLRRCPTDWWGATY